MNLEAERPMQAYSDTAGFQTGGARSEGCSIGGLACGSMRN